jgi:hypothetical protein
MNTMTLTRPEPTESAPGYHGYIARVSDQNLGEQLSEQLREIEQLFEDVTDRAALARYAEGKWSIKEILGHLVDAERIFAYRLLRIARGDQTPLPGFDENAYVPAGRFDERPLPMLLTELRSVRHSTMALIEGLPEEGWLRSAVANGQPISARALAFIIVGHMAHHLEVLRSRYGLGRELMRRELS